MSPPAYPLAPAFSRGPAVRRSRVLAVLVLAFLATSPAFAKKAPADPNAPPALASTDRSFVSAVRRELDLQPGGAPPITTLTNSQVSMARIKPLQDKLAALDPATHLALRAVAHADLGNALAMRQLDEAAAAEYLTAIELDPSLAPAWNNLASLLRRQRKPSLAQRALNSVFQLEPHNGLAWFNQAILHEDQGDLEKADEAYYKALTYQPSLWLPSQNPLVIGNRRAQLALLRSYLKHGGASGSVTLDPNPIILP